MCRLASHVIKLKCLTNVTDVQSLQISDEPNAMDDDDDPFTEKLMSFEVTL